MKKKKTDYWTEYEKQVAEWFASGDCNSFNKAMAKANEQKKLWKSQHKYEIVGNEWDPWNVAGVPWETWKNLNMENMESDARKRLVETMNETRTNDQEWIFFKNRLQQFRGW